ncbi:MAG TPA: TIM barrel protein [Rhizomicrobium sp.]|nr:TIM barrel protein [Rhizomicrobium sp.]
MLNFAANLSWMFKEWAFLDRFAAAADADFSHVECLFPYDHTPDDIARQLARNKLKLVLFNAPPGDLSEGERGLASLPDRQDEFRASVETALDYARATGVGRVHLMSGLAAGDPALALATFREAIRFACDAAAGDGIDVMIEPINNRDVPGYLMNDFALAEQLIAELKLPNLKLQFDIYHRQVIHGEVMRGLEMLMPITGHIQISSVSSRHEPMSGALDDFAILRAIDRLGYAGYIGCEYNPAAGTLAGLEWMKRLAGTGQRINTGSGSTFPTMNR